MTYGAPLTYPLGAGDLRSIVTEAIPAAPILADAPSAAGSRAPVVAIGAFDGVHLGHRELIGTCVNEARTSVGRSVVVTFDPDPSEVTHPDRAEARLLSVADRVGHCRMLGVDEVVIIPFDRAFAARSPHAFVEYLIERVGRPSAVHVGSNFRFGARGAGTAATLAELAATHGFATVSHGLLVVDGESVSSTRIRGLLAEGRVAEARRLLGRSHFVRGVVQRGRGEGTAFGFPTANLRCDALSCLPREGVYACLVTDGERAWPAAVNVGAPPTFSERLEGFLEANLIGFVGDLYGRELSVVFLEWLRPSRSFSSIEELERVVLGNIDWVRRNVGTEAVEVSA